MKILSILPIARGIRKELLTYFSTEDIALGTIVGIPLRKKEITGIVIDSKDALDSKAEIKSMDFILKKIVKKRGSLSLPSWLIETASSIAEDSATSTGAVLAALIPSQCLLSPELFFKDTSGMDRGTSFETLAIQSDDSERYDTYKSIIRESLAKKKSIAIISPTEESARMLETLLAKGITDRTFLYSNLKSKKSLSAWHKKVSTSTIPLLLIGPPQMLALLPTSVGTIVVEEEYSPFYKMRRQPYLNIRHVARWIARSLGIRIIYGDRLLSVETLARIREGKTQEYSRVSKRSPYKIKTLLLDMRQKVSEDGKKDEFKVISQDLEEMIRYSMSQGKRLFLYSTRRGLSPQTVCRDCGETVICNECESPVVLHGKESERKFICHHCGRSRSALEQCRNCSSWNLVSYGIGIERVREEVEKIVGHEIIQVDSDTCKTTKEVKTRIDNFLSTKSSILIGTDLALNALPAESVEFAAITSIDSLASLPDFRTSERIMHTIIDVKARAQECLIVQSRNVSEQVIEQALSGDLELFAKNEIRDRKEFGYPPYQRLVKLTVSGSKERIKTDVSMVTDRLKDFSPRIFPAFIKSTNGEMHMHIMMKIPQALWPNKELTNILLSLPPNIKIDTTPQSLL